MSAETDHESRYKLAEALAAGMPKAQAARVAGYARPHLYRVLKDPAFGRMLEAAQKRRAELAAATGAGVSDGDVRAAVSYLRAVVDGTEKDDDGQAVKPDMVRVTAAKALIAASGAIKRAPAKQATPEPEAAPAPLKVLSPKEAADQWRKRAQ